MIIIFINLIIVCLRFWVWDKFVECLVTDNEYIVLHFYMFRLVLFYSEYAVCVFLRHRNFYLVGWQSLLEILSRIDVYKRQV